MFRKAARFAAGIVLKAAAIGTVTALMLSMNGTGRAAGLPSLKTVQGYSLAFFNTHTNESAALTFRRGDYMDIEAMDMMKHLARDHRSGRKHDVDPELIVLLYDLKTVLEKRHPGLKVRYDIISGYRAPETNAMMRASGGGQAKDSRHMHGDAIDIRVPGVDLVELRNTAWCLQRGGVGYYKGSNFIHVDTDKVRHWKWKPAPGLCAKKG